MNLQIQSTQLLMIIILISSGLGLFKIEESSSSESCLEDEEPGNTSKQTTKDSLHHLKEILRKNNDQIPRPPIFLFPGIASTKLVSWKYKKCLGPDINILDNIWLNIQKVIGSLTIDPRCWLECLKLGKNQSDPEGCKVRADEGLGGIMNTSGGGILGSFLGITIFEWLIKYLADELGYDINSIIAMGYDWRLSPGRLEERDQYFSWLKRKIEAAVKQHKRPGIVIAHSMGNHIMDYFIQWGEREYSRNYFQNWVSDHIWGYVGLSAPLLGASNPLKCVLSGENFGLGITDEQARELELTLGSTMWNSPRSTLHNSTKAPLPQTWTEGEDWHPDIVSVRSRDSTAQMVFGVSAIEGGEIFHWLSTMYNDSTLSEFYNDVSMHYHSQPINQLKHPPSRPPVKHVMMVYGVNLTTEMGYSYIQDSSLGRPVLDEMMWENPDDVIMIKTTGKKEKRILRKNHLRRSGDSVVSYLSLSWAHTWLGGSNIETTSTPETKVLKAGPAFGMFDAQKVLPATTKYESSDPSSGRSTVVLEIDGVNHREITSDPFTLRITLDALFEKVAEEMCLEQELDKETAGRCLYDSKPQGFANFLGWLGINPNQ